MVDVGETAPEFMAPMATPAAANEPGSYTTEDVESFRLSEAVATGPVVLAFFPGAFSRTCTHELCRFRDWQRDLTGLDVRVYGVSADTPWSLLAFIEEYDINYPLLSGFNNSVIEDYDMALDSGLMAGIAGRAVLVVDRDRTVAYRWEGTGLQELPDFDALAEAVAAV